VDRRLENIMACNNIRWLSDSSFLVDMIFHSSQHQLEFCGLEPKRFSRLCWWLINIKTKFETWSILISGFGASHSIELSVEGFFIYEILRLRQAMRAIDSSCRALAGRSWATGSIPARATLNFLQLLLDKNIQNYHLQMYSSERCTGIAFTGPHAWFLPEGIELHCFVTAAGLH
jgi:hypothetical protein